MKKLGLHEAKQLALIIMALQNVLCLHGIAGKLVCCFYYYKCDEFLPHENVVAHEHHSHGLIIKISATTKFPQNCSYILDSGITIKSTP